MYNFYLSNSNPTGLTGTVGGTITTTPLSGYLGEVFAFVSAAPSGSQTGSFQYRKIFVKNEYASSSTQTKTWLDAVEHTGQIHIAKETTVGDTSTDPTVQPAGVTGWVSPQTYIEGLNIGTLAANSSTGIWVRQTLSGISRPDPYATFRLNVGGLVS